MKKVSRVSHSQDDRQCPFRQIAGRRFARRMDKLGGKETAREILSNDTVVRERLCSGTRSSVGLIAALANFNAVVGCSSWLQP